MLLSNAVQGKARYIITEGWKSPSYESEENNSEFVSDDMEQPSQPKLALKDATTARMITKHYT